MWSKCSYFLTHFAVSQRQSTAQCLGLLASAQLTLCRTNLCYCVPIYCIISCWHSPQHFLCTLYYIYQYNRVVASGTNSFSAELMKEKSNRERFCILSISSSSFTSLPIRWCTLISDVEHQNKTISVFNVVVFAPMHGETIISC